MRTILDLLLLIFAVYATFKADLFIDKNIKDRKLSSIEGKWPGKYNFDGNSKMYSIIPYIEEWIYKFIFKIERSHIYSMTLMLLSIVLIILTSIYASNIIYYISLIFSLIIIRINYILQLRRGFSLYDRGMIKMIKLRK